MIFQSQPLHEKGTFFSINLDVPNFFHRKTAGGINPNIFIMYTNIKFRENYVKLYRNSNTFSMG